MKSFILMVITMVCAISLEAQNKSFYDFNVTTIDGKEFPLSSLKGKKVLVVNVASKCGLTPQYAKLQELYDKYKDKNFVIIGFPANNFMGQELGRLCGPQRESALGENRYLDRAGVGAGKRDGIRDTFFNSPSKLGVKIPFPRFSSISSMVQNRPPSSSSLGCSSPS